MAHDPVPLLLINARKTSLLTQKQVAERAGTNQAAVAKYEAGTKTPSVDTLIRLLKANGFDLVLDVKKTKKIYKRSELYKRVQAHRGEIRNLLHSAGATNIRIFGSVARGDDDDMSDLDILVQRVEGANVLDIYKCHHAIKRMVGVRVDIGIEHLLISEVRKSALRDAIPL
ncbi:MAG: helix-turn-helix domain-containing protein [Candidatus Nanopelagicaceae bacterium]